MWDNIKNFWIKLPANRQRQIVISAVCLVLFFILWQFLFGDTYEAREKTEPSTISLTSADTERFGMDALERRLSNMDEQIEGMKVERQEERENLTEEMESMEDSYEQRVEQLQAEVEEERKAREQAEKKAQDQADEVETVDDQTIDQAAERVATERSGAEQQPQEDQGSEQKDIWENENRYQSGSGGFSNRNDDQDDGPPSPEIRSNDGEQKQEGESETKTASMKVIESETDDSESDSGKEEEEGPSQYIPAGSIISGTLITGLDAPTSQQARGEPHPTLMRVSKDTILPNRYKADMRECFIIISGYGDMSAERAYMRSEALSCITEDGEAMEVGLNSFAVGEDGKAGVRGRLVSREGQMIAQSVMAGGLSAMSEVFSSSPVPTINTESSGQKPFQNALSGESAQAGAMGGAGDAMERVADYYLEMADQIFPVLEVDAGRSVDLVVNKGTKVEFAGN